MKRLVTGIDDDGRSCVLDDRAISFTDLVPGLAVDRIFALRESPPPPRPAGRADLVDLGVAPGQSSWVLWRFLAHADVAAHHTDTIDLDFIVEGTVELILDDGAHLLDAGDCVIMNGVDHAWRAGPKGCVISAVAIGSTPLR